MSALSIVLAVVCALFTPAPVAQEVTATVDVGGQAFATVLATSAGASVLVPSNATNPGGPNVGSDQVLSTTVQDPNNPKEPWEITTYRRSGESAPAFIKRHKDMVDSVRDALGV